jgi:hypothetical protein
MPIPALHGITLAENGSQAFSRRRCIGVPGRQAAALRQIENVIPSENPIKLVLLGIAMVGILYVLFTMSLQLSCWFALVETTFKRCAWLTLILLVPTAVAWGLTYWMLQGIRSENQVTIGRLWPLPVIWMLALLSCGYWTRRVLECRWRSVLTIYVMFNVSAKLMTLLALLLALLILFGFSFALPDI